MANKLKFETKLGRIPFIYSIGNDEDSDEYKTILINESSTDTRYDGDIECYILTIQEFINREATTIVDCYFEDLIHKMEMAESDWNITDDNSLINTLLGLDRKDYSKNGGYDKLIKRAKSYITNRLDTIMKNNCLEVKGKLVHNNLVFYVL